MLNEIMNDLKKLKNTEKSKILSRFFKTGKGEYGEGDKFLGIMISPLRQLSEKYYKKVTLKDIQRLLNGKYHEERSLALSILKRKYKKENDNGKKEIVFFYLKNTKNINNWDLVDISAPDIIGDYLFDKDRGILYNLARSENLWERRIAILATFHFIKKNDFSDTLKISELLLGDKHDLIHKAIGWMLREVGKRNQYIEEQFLKKHYKKIPRTTLKYAIERFYENKRKFYLGK